MLCSTGLAIAFTGGGVAVRGILKNDESIQILFLLQKSPNGIHSKKYLV